MFKLFIFLSGMTVFLILLPAFFHAEADPLKMAYNERPPYHYTEKGSPVPRGLVADIVVRAIKDSGIEALYIGMETNRIMAEIKGNDPFCSFGWFKNKERMQYANFTHGIWQDEPFVVVTKKEKEHIFRKHRTLASLFGDRKLQFGTRMGTSYGSYIDRLKTNSKLNIIEPANTQSNMVKMLSANRFDFMILLPTEIKSLFREARVDLDNFVTLEYPDIPKGGKRRIMCSKSVPNEVIHRLNSSISKVAASGTIE